MPARGRTIYYLVKHDCPCYCGGEGRLDLIVCPECGVVVARCDEVAELIRDVHAPRFDADESICNPEERCPSCGKGRYGDFRSATAAELRKAGLRKNQYRRLR